MLWKLTVPLFPEARFAGSVLPLGVSQLLVTSVLCLNASVCSCCRGWLSFSREVLMKYCFFVQWLDRASLCGLPELWFLFARFFKVPNLFFLFAL